MAARASRTAAQRQSRAVPGDGNVLSGVLLVGGVHDRLRRWCSGRHVVPMYHPAAALRQASVRETLFRDIRGLPVALLDARRALDDERAASVEQVTLC